MNDAPIPLIVDLPQVAQPATERGRRFVYFVCTEDGVPDREGEMVAADALWASRDEFMGQGNLDIAHWAWLPNPLTGRPQPEYVIGVPVDVKRAGRRILAKGEVFSNITAPPEDGNGMWADRFWHSQFGQQPPMRYYPSVYGTIVPGGVEMTRVNGQPVRRITKVTWKSVGFWTRVQHPTVPAVTTDPYPEFAKAEDAASIQARDAYSGALRLSWGQFAKAVSEVGAPITDHAQLTGVQALTRSSVDPRVRQIVPGGDVSAKAARVVVLRALKAGRIPATRAALVKAFRSQKLPEDEARAEAESLLHDLAKNS